MNGFLRDIATYDFLRNALLASTLVGLSTALISPIVVYKRMEFVGDGTAHAAFAGLALGVILGFEYRIAAVGTAVVFALTISLLSGRRKISENSAIGMLLPVFMSIGIIVLSFSRRYTTDVMSYLFGDILLVEMGDLYFLTTLFVLLIILFYTFRYDILYFLSDEYMAAFYGLKTNLVRTCFLIAISVVVVGAVKVAGVILVSAFIVIPGLVGKLFGKSFKQVLAVSLTHNLAISIAGLAASYYLDLPPGPVMVILSFGIFMFFYAFKK
ncbi:MAG: zinc transport system permease protein [Thermotogota bacterium]|nr:zinc transport system permease protein [Thermotogota bacterium]MDK2864061.1 zinc transport system permease protein [Thermotogota bacterium]HCZ06298.1 metal ABC transporter permease [Thermotogota bacterium]